MSSLLLVLCEYLHQGLTLTSFLLERCLSRLHSAIHTTLSSLSRVNAETTATERAWWDTSKGSAVVVWASGDQSISQALAISLASIRAKSGSRRAGRPPYTVIVVLPSTSYGLSSLISSWATRKARIESGKEASFRGRGLKITSWGVFGLGSLSLRLGSPESHSSEASDGGKEAADHPKRPSDGSSSPGSHPSTPGKRRKVSFSSWTASDVVGFGKDMLKGLQIGQKESSGLGAVIPVVADTSTSEGIHHAYSTIRAYCTSHNLLLRSLVVLPSVMSTTLPTPPPSTTHPAATVQATAREHRRSSGSSRSREVTSALEADEISNQARVAGVSSLSRSNMRSTRAALQTDIGETMELVASLAPALKSDGGRVVAILPTAFRRIQSGRRRGENKDDDFEYNITRSAMLEMWSILTKKLAAENIQVSQIHMSSASPMQQHRHPANKSVKLRHAAMTKKASLASKVVSLAGEMMSQAHYALYPAPHKAFESPLDTPSTLRDYAGEKEEIEDETISLCPTLLLDAVRSVLVRSWPRSHYYVGLGPRLEIAWECVPGHTVLRDWLQRQIRVG